MEHEWRHSSPLSAYEKKAGKEKGFWACITCMKVGPSWLREEQY